MIYEYTSKISANMLNEGPFDKHSYAGMAHQI